MADPIPKTIKPSGGDYTTLQAWEDWADGEANADQWAECYSGVDMQALTISGWASTPSASLYPKVYAAPGEGHGGFPTAGAYTTGVVIVEENYTRIEGIRLSKSGGGHCSITIKADNVTTDGNLFSGTCGGPGIITSTAPNDTYSGLVMKNNIIDRPFGTGGIVLYCYIDTGTVSIDAKVMNNSIYDINANGYSHINFIAFGGTSITCTITLENNISMNSTGSDFTWNAGGSPTVYITSNNNLSSDTTANLWGATNYLTEKTDTDIFNSPSTGDFSLKSDSEALDAGKTLSEVLTDAIGTARPQGSDYDMGAIETIVNDTLIPIRHLMGSCI